MAHVAVVFVRLTGLVFLGFGVACVIAPAQMLEAATGAIMQHPVGLIDLRATYGGMSLGVAVILFGLAGSKATLRAGLWGVMAIMVGMAGGRVVGIVVSPESNWVMSIYLTLEVVAALVSVGLLFQLPAEKHRH